MERYIDLESYAQKHNEAVKAEIMRGAQQALPFLKGMFAISEERRLNKLAVDNYRAQMQAQTDHQIANASKLAEANANAQVAGQKVLTDSNYHQQMGQNEANQMIGQQTALIRSGYHQNVGRLSAQTEDAKQKALIQSGYFDRQNEIEGQRILSEAQFTIDAQQKMLSEKDKIEQKEAYDRYRTNLAIINGTNFEQFEGKDYLNYNNQRFPFASGKFSERFNTAYTEIIEYEQANPDIAAELYLESYDSINNYVNNVVKKDDKYYIKKLDKKGKQIKDDNLLLKNNEVENYHKALARISPNKYSENFNKFLLYKIKDHSIKDMHDRFKDFNGTIEENVRFELTRKGYDPSIFDKYLSEENKDFYRSKYKDLTTDMDKYKALRLLLNVHFGGLE